MAMALLIMIAAGIGRRFYDTRLYFRIYNDQVVQLAKTKFSINNDPTQVIGHVRLLRVLVDFFEQNIPNAARSLFALVGAGLMLAWLNLPMLGLALAALVLLSFLTRRYGKLAERLNRIINHFGQRETKLLIQLDPARTNHHFNKVSQWRIQLSDAEAGTFGILWLYATLLIVFAIYLSTKAQQPPGQIFAQLTYLLGFIEALQGLPILVERWTQVTDIIKRIGTETLT
jgi:ABC-type multidrug transport system fused ATPase/permease subunit